MGNCCCCKKKKLTQTDSDEDDADLISPFLYDDRLAPLTQPIADADEEPDPDNNKSATDCIRIHIIDGRRAVFAKFI